MNRRQKYLAIGLFVLIVVKVEAVGFSELIVRSGLGQYLDADITIKQSSGEIVDPDEFSSQIANPALHQRNDIDGRFARQNILMNVLSDEQGNLKLKLTSRIPIKEPIVHFLMDISWQTGRLLKETVLLLDPPSYQIAQSTNNSHTITQTRPKIEATKAEYQNGVYGPVQYGETLFRIAYNLRPKGRGIELDEMMAAILKQNPKAFRDGKAEGLMQGYNLTIPTADDIIALRSAPTPTPWEELTDTVTVTHPEETGISEQAKTTPVENINRSAESLLKALQTLASKLTTLKFSTVLKPAEHSSAAIKQQAIEPLSLQMDSNFSEDSQNIIAAFNTVEIPIDEILSDTSSVEAESEEIETKYIIEEELPEIEYEELVSETELIETVEVAEEIIEEESEAELINEAEIELEEEVEEVIEAVDVENEVTDFQEQAITETTTPNINLFDSLLNRFKAFLLPLLGLAVVLLATLFWFISKRARRNVSESAVLDAIDRAHEDQDKDDKTILMEETEVDETELEEASVENKINLTEEKIETRETGKEYTKTDEMEFEETELEGTIAETNEPAKVPDKDMDVDVPLSMEDTYSEEDIVIDEDDYEDLLDITSDQSKNEETIIEKATQQLDLEDEPLTLDMDLYEETAGGIEIDPAQEEFEQEVNVRIAYGDLEGARGKVEKAISSDPDNLHYKLLLLNVLNSGDTTEEARKLAHELKQLDELPRVMKIKVDTVLSELENGKEKGLV